MNEIIEYQQQRIVVAPIENPSSLKKSEVTSSHERSREEQRLQYLLEKYDKPVSEETRQKRMMDIDSGKIPGGW